LEETQEIKNSRAKLLPAVMKHLLLLLQMQFAFLPVQQFLQVPIL
jgi:hypothetical protein